MNTSKKLIGTIVASIALSAAAPVFADSYHGRGYDHRDYNRHEFRDYDRYGYRHHYDGRRVVVVERPYVVQRAYVMQPPVLYSAPMPAYGPAQMIGSAIGSIIDNQ